jgi:hypothetical protein
VAQIALIINDLRRPESPFCTTKILELAGNIWAQLHKNYTQHTEAGDDLPEGMITTPDPESTKPRSSKASPTPRHLRNLVAGNFRVQSIATRSRD